MVEDKKTTEEVPEVSETPISPEEVKEIKEVPPEDAEIEAWKPKTKLGNKVKYPILFGA